MNLYFYVLLILEAFILARLYIAIRYIKYLEGHGRKIVLNGINGCKILLAECLARHVILERH